LTGFGWGFDFREGTSLNDFNKLYDDDDDWPSIFDRERRHPPHVSGFDKEETLIIFDWDDTLLPSSWLSQSACLSLSDVSKPNAEQMLVLNETSDVVVQLLEAALNLGRVVIVTNAEAGWVQLTAAKFMPSVYNFLAEESVEVVSARTMYESDLNATPLSWKILAFKQTIKYNFPGCVREYEEFEMRLVAENDFSSGDEDAARNWNETPTTSELISEQYMKTNGRYIFNDNDVNGLCEYVNDPQFLSDSPIDPFDVFDNGGVQNGCADCPGNAVAHTVYGREFDDLKFVGGRGRVLSVDGYSRTQMRVTRRCWSADDVLCPHHIQEQTELTVMAPLYDGNQKLADSQDQHDDHSVSESQPRIDDDGGSSVKDGSSTTSTHLPHDDDAAALSSNSTVVDDSCRPRRCLRRNIVSVGDSQSERSALMSSSKPLHNTLYKCVKFAEHPNADQLHVQLLFLLPRLESVVHHDSVLDLKCCPYRNT